MLLFEAAIFYASRIAHPPSPLAAFPVNCPPIFPGSFGSLFQLNSLIPLISIEVLYSTGPSMLRFFVAVVRVFPGLSARLRLMLVAVGGGESCLLVSCEVCVWD